MRHIRIRIPKELAGFMPDERAEVLRILNFAKTLPKEMPLDFTDDSDIFSPNSDPILAELEDELYNQCAQPFRDGLTEVMHAFGFHVPWALRGDELEKSVKDKFLKMVKESGTWTSEQLKKLNGLLAKSEPNYAKIAEEFALKTGLVAKLRAKLGVVDIDEFKKLIDSAPKTIALASRKSVVLTERQKAYAEAHGTKDVTILPLTERERWALSSAKERAASKIQDISQRVRNRIKLLVTDAVDNRWSSRELETALREEFGDLNRDWRRMAITELAMVHNDAHCMNAPEGSEVWVSPIHGACKYCQRMLEGKTFIILHEEPSPMTLEHELHYLWPGKTNYGRGVAAWVPCLPLHPNCRHRATPVSRFYKVEEGRPKLKSSIELIQEERIRRGLPPDPDIKAKLDKLKRELAISD